MGFWKNLRYNLGAKIMMTLITIIFLMFLTLGFYQIRYTNVFIMMYDIIVFSVAQILIATIVVWFFFGKQPESSGEQG